MQVSEITSIIKQILEEGFPEVYVEGEISNFRPAGSGHYYFSLKDKFSVIQAVMFKNKNMRLSFKPEDGMLVRVRGQISVYAQRGNYQIICGSMEKAGQGRILLALEERKKKLAAEGLFDESRKKSLPLYPSSLAVVTSPSGAAIRDILRVIGRRNSGMRVIILPALVQGEGAAAGIAAQIRRADKFKFGEVIIIGRGGGSLEDLLPFSEEIVVRAVAECSTPIISAVGHEIDFALCDFAADLRAATPSAAAELVTANREDVLKSVEAGRRQITASINSRISSIKNLIEKFKPASLERELRILMQPLLMRFDDVKEGMLTGIKTITRQTGQRVKALREHLEAVSPENVMRRGYAVVSLEENGEIVISSEQAPPGAALNIALAKGKLKAEVKNDA